MNGITQELTILICKGNLKNMKRIPLVILVILLCLVGKAQYNKGVTIEPILKTDTTSIGESFMYPDMQKDEITILKITFKPGQSTGWHKHNFPVFAYVLKGNLTVEPENGKTMCYSKGSSFSEIIDTYHNGVNKGKKDVVLIVFYLGEKGRSLSVQKEAVHFSTQ
jgi:quercetin dioxygenase-like cupin family protein